MKLGLIRLGQREEMAKGEPAELGWEGGRIQTGNEAMCSTRTDYFGHCRRGPTWLKLDKYSVFRASPWKSCLHPTSDEAFCHQATVNFRPGWVAYQWSTLSDMTLRVGTVLFFAGAQRAADWARCLALALSLRLDGITVPCGFTDKVLPPPS